MSFEQGAINLIQFSYLNLTGEIRMFGKMFHKQASENSPLLKEYNQLRNVSKRLSEEIPEIYGLDKSLPQIIRIMGIGRSGNIVLESEEEVNLGASHFCKNMREESKLRLRRLGDLP